MPLCKQNHHLKSNAHSIHTLYQISTHVPREFVNAAAKAHKIKWREFDPWSHLMTLVSIQLSRHETLNGICDIVWLKKDLEIVCDSMR